MTSVCQTGSLGKGGCCWVDDYQTACSRKSRHQLVSSYQTGSLAEAGYCLVSVHKTVNLGETRCCLVSVCLSGCHLVSD